MAAMTTNQVTTVAAIPSAAPAPTGRRSDWFEPMKLAVKAASTRIDSSPSRNTSSALSKTTALWLIRVDGSVGSLTPPAAAWAAKTATRNPASTPMTSHRLRLSNTRRKRTRRA